MRNALKLVPRPEEQFIERYERLHAWALAVTSGNEDEADDLVHDAFIQFTLRRAELGTIENTDGYLKRMLRNMFVSRLRRSSNLQQIPSAAADYDSAELGLRILEPQMQMQIVDELRRICRYAAERKETSRAASVLILRFFHGYYLNEIGQVLRSPMDSIYSFLKVARREAKLYLADSDSLKFVVPPPAEIRAVNAERTRSRLLIELRNFIFSSRRGACIPRGQLDQLYAKEATAKLDCASIAHIVSCPTCLDEINQMLDLPLLAERHPIDTLGGSDDDQRDKDGTPKGGGPKDGGSGGNSTNALKRKHGRRFKELFDHRPQELRISVNGFVLGSQKVGQELNEQTITVNIDERIGFVEVFSEQGVRLLFCDVEEPADGDIEQRAKALLSDGRKLELTLNFRSTWPTLHVLYLDPVLKADTVVEGQANEELTNTEKEQVVKPSGRFSRLGRLKTQRHLVSVWHVIKDHRFRFFWLRPATITALAALLLISTVLLTQFKLGPASLPSAGALLAQAVTAEQAIAARTDRVIHRTINLEVSTPGVASGSAPQLIERRRIEIWQSANKGVTARRLFDEKNQLIAGDWRRADGVQTIYHHGARPQLQLSPEKRSGGAVLSFDNVWQFDVAAKEFSSLIGQTERLGVQERPDAYVLVYESDDRNVLNNLLSAALFVNRVDLRATQQTLLIRQGAELREYRFTEDTFELRPANSIAPAFFEPEPELLGPVRLETPAPVTGPGPTTPISATADDEVEVLRLLNQAGVFLRDQVSVVRGPTGQLVVGGVVETDERKRQIATALDSVTRARPVRVEIETVAEVLQRQQARAASDSVTIQGVQVTESRIPVDSDLRKYLSVGREVSAQQLDAEVQRFAEQMLAHSNQARLHILALRPVIERFSMEELQALSPEARLKWRAIINEHVRAFTRETAALRRGLESVFPSLGLEAGTGSASVVDSDADRVSAVKRLIVLASANNEAVQQSFSITANSNKSASVRTAQFWRSLATAETLAAQISQNRER